MRFLFDESVDSRLAGHLVILGHDATVVGRDYPASLSDSDVLAIAHQEGRILITNDKDFGELVFDRHQPHAGVILFRLEEATLATQINRLNHVLAEHAPDLGRFIVASEWNVRVR